MAIALAHPTPVHARNVAVVMGKEVSGGEDMEGKIARLTQLQGHIIRQPLCPLRHLVQCMCEEVVVGIPGARLEHLSHRVDSCDDGVTHDHSLQELAANVIERDEFQARFRQKSSEQRG